MSAKKAGGRPPKTKRPPMDTRVTLDSPVFAPADWAFIRDLLKSENLGASFPEESPENPPWATGEKLEIFNAVARLRMTQRLLVDPYGDNPDAARLFAEIMLGKPSDSTKQIVGAVLVSAIKNFPSAELEKFFRLICDMKKNVEKPQRNAFAHLAYSVFILEVGREPTRHELKKYIIARPDIYKGQIGPEDYKGWDRLWDDSGLFGLSGNVGTKGRQVPKYASSAYARFMNEVGREPSKTDLKHFILDRPNTYKQAPAGENRKAWTALWKQSGLFGPPAARHETPV